MSISIADSVKEELAYIGTTVKKTLPETIGYRIKNPKNFLSGAEKQAKKDGMSLEVSWASAAQKSAEPTKKQAHPGL